MHLKTILNRVQKFKSFVHSSVRWVEGAREPMIKAVGRGKAPVDPDVCLVFGGLGQAAQLFVPAAGCS